jgi:hypothetical protein
MRRTGFSKQIKDAINAKYGCNCFINVEEMPAADLQIDHRVPFEVGIPKWRLLTALSQPLHQFVNPRCL